MQPAHDGTTALMVAAYQAGAVIDYPVALVQSLVQYGNADPNMESKCCKNETKTPPLPSCCWSPLMAAAHQGNFKNYSITNIGSQQNILVAYNYTCIHINYIFMLCHIGQLEVVRFLVENGGTHHIEKVIAQLKWSIENLTKQTTTTTEDASKQKKQKAKHEWNNIVEFLSCFNMMHDLDKC